MDRLGLEKRDQDKVMLQGTNESASKIFQLHQSSNKKVGSLRNEPNGEGESGFTEGSSFFRK